MTETYTSVVHQALVEFKMSSSIVQHTTVIFCVLFEISPSEIFIILLKANGGITIKKSEVFVNATISFCEVVLVSMMILVADDHFSWQTWENVEYVCDDVCVDRRLEKIALELEITVGTTDFFFFLLKTALKRQWLKDDEHIIINVTMELKRFQAMSSRKVSNSHMSTDKNVYHPKEMFWWEYSVN